MIEFSFNVSDESVEIFRRATRKNMLKVFAAGFLLFAIFVLNFVSFFAGWHLLSRVLNYVVIAYGIIILPLVFYMIVRSIRRGEKEPEKIIINEDTSILLSYATGFSEKIKPFMIGRVIDAKTVYCIQIKPIFFLINNGIICQKDLILSGELSDFERIYSGKIQKDI